MIHNVVQFGNILFMSFESFGELGLHFRPTFDAGAVRRCIAIVRAIQADCLARYTLYPCSRPVDTSVILDARVYGPCPPWTRLMYTGTELKDDMQ